MINKNQKKQDKGKSGINPMAAVVTGAVVGAGVAIAGAVALSDKKNREKVKKVLSNAKDQAVGYMEDLQEKAQDTKNEVEKKLAESKKKE